MLAGGSEQGGELGLCRFQGSPLLGCTTRHVWVVAGRAGELWSIQEEKALTQWPAWPHLRARGEQRSRRALRMALAAGRGLLQLQLQADAWQVGRGGGRG